jgi:histidyl-tRNA synthetase
MPSIKPTLPKGTRDFLPEQMYRRQYVIDTMKLIFEKYGYEPLETPSIEKLDVLSGKYGDEGDKLIFKLLRRGTGLEELLKDRQEFVITEYGQMVDEALRYDLTVPLSRVVAMYQNELNFPFKRYQIQPVWRADRPQRGRYREFFQCDADTVGTDSILADAETVAIVYEVLSTLGFKNFKIRINNRKVLNGILEYGGVDAIQGSSVLTAIDKLEKIGFDGVRQELIKRGISRDQVQRIFSVIDLSGVAEAVLQEMVDSFGENELLLEGAGELQQLLAGLADLGVPTEFRAVDLGLARGLGYYTGPIYESVVEEPKIGSLSGGGRYDNLIGMFLGRDIPATGTAFGIERIIEVMAQLDMFPDSKTKTQVLVTIFDDEGRAASLAFAQHLRQAGIRTESVFDATKMKKQLSYADKKGIRYVAILGPDERDNDRVTIKDLTSGEQQTLERERCADYFKMAEP